MVRWSWLILCPILLLTGCIYYEENSREGQFIVPKQCRVTTENDFRHLSTRQEVARWLDAQGVRVTQVGESTVLSIPVSYLFTSPDTMNRMQRDGTLKGDALMEWIAAWINAYEVEKVEVQGKQYVKQGSIYREGFLLQQADQIRASLVKHHVNAGIIFSSARLVPHHEGMLTLGDMKHVIKIRFRYLHQA